jgi:hypothetical protein
VGVRALRRRVIPALILLQAERRSRKFRSRSSQAVTEAALGRHEHRRTGKPREAEARAPAGAAGDARCASPPPQPRQSLTGAIRLPTRLLSSAPRGAGPSNWSADLAPATVTDARRSVGGGSSSVRDGRPRRIRVSLTPRGAASRRQARIREGVGPRVRSSCARTRRSACPNGSPSSSTVCRSLDRPLAPLLGVRTILPVWPTTGECGWSSPTSALGGISPSSSRTG